MNNIRAMPAQPTGKRYRNPSVPCIDPIVAGVRAHELYKAAGQEWLTVADAARLWGRGAKSSTAFRVVAALIAYELAEAKTEAGSRLIRVSAMAEAAFADPASGGELPHGLVIEAALKPKLIAQYAKLWLDGRPGDAACISQLKLRHRFSEQAAERFLELLDFCIGLVRYGTTRPGAKGETKPKPSAPSPAARPEPVDVTSELELNQPKFVHQGSRLEIGAFLDPEGLRLLLRMLSGYGQVMEVTAARNTGAQVRIIEPQERTAAVFPILGLQWASQHALWLYQYAGFKSIPIGEAAKVWSGYGLTAGSPAFFDTVDGLVQFGFCELEGDGAGQKICLSKLGCLALQPLEPQLKRRAFTTLALRPKLLAHYAQIWGEETPEEAVSLSQLVGEQGFTEELAMRFLRVFDEVAPFIGKPVLDPETAPAPQLLLSQSEIRVVQQGTTLWINAVVDLAGMDRLVATLSHYEKILELWDSSAW